MNTKRFTCLCVLVFICLFAVVKANAQDTLSKAEAQKWLAAKAWSGGVQVSPHPYINAQEFYRQYKANKAVWDKAFRFIQDHDLNTLAPGKYPIDGDNAYASVTEAPSKELDKASWESHRNYIDLQYVIRGKETISVADINKATVTKPYDPTKDVANYTANGTDYLAEPGTFFLFFPQDAHRPNVKVAGYDVVKKMVIKIKTAL